MQSEFLGNPISNYLTFLFAIFAIYVAYFILMRLIQSRLLRGLSESQPEFYGKLVELSRNPLKLAFTAFAISVSVRIFAMPALVELVIKNLVLALLALTGCYLLLKVVDALIVFLKSKVAKTESTLDDRLLPILSTGLKAFIVIVSVLLVLQNGGYNITSLLAGLGLGGLAIALAAQDTLSNIFGAIAIFADQPFLVGDAVDVEGVTGSIEAIGIRSTRIRTFDGTLVTIPNSKIAQTKIDNLNARPRRRTNFTIGVTYDTSYEKLRRAVQILREVMAANPGTAQYRAYFNSYGDFSLNILAQHWCKYLDYEEYLKCLEEINFEIKKQFEDEGIEFAFPTQTLYVIPEESSGAAKSNASAPEFSK